MIFLVFFSVIPFRIPGIGPVFPMLDVMMVFFWAIHRPQALPHWFIFVFGVLQDLLYGMPIGITPFLNLILWFASAMQRRLFANEAFAIVWGAFFLFSLVLATMKWLLMMLVMQDYISPVLLIIQWVLTFLAYPSIHWINNILDERLPDQ